MSVRVQQDAQSAPVPNRQELLAAIRELAPLLRERGVGGLSLFGSVLHGVAGPDSDIDLLLDVAPGARVSLIDQLIIRDLIADRLGCPVDLVAREALIEEIREQVEREAEPILP